MGKQILEKCLTTKPQPEQIMWTSVPIILATHYFSSRIPEKVLGKTNHPKFQQLSLLRNEKKHCKGLGKGRTLSKLG